jgi:hypothetical protein
MDQRAIFPGGDRQASPGAEMAEQWAPDLVRTAQGESIRVGYGKCARCSCPGFFGSSYTCSRGGCGHHYDEHW